MLSFSKARRGCFGYLAIRGGFDGAVVLGSRSTYVAGRLGGHFGRALRRDDVLDVLEGGGRSGLVADAEMLEWPLRRESVRFLRGPQPEYFAEGAYRAFTSDPYTVSPRSNRMAHRLTGPALEIEPVPPRLEHRALHPQQLRVRPRGKALCHEPPPVGACLPGTRAPQQTSKRSYVPSKRAPTTIKVQLFRRVRNTERSKKGMNRRPLSVDLAGHSP